MFSVTFASFWWLCCSTSLVKKGKSRPGPVDWLRSSRITCCTFSHYLYSFKGRALQGQNLTPVTAPSFAYYVTWSTWFFSYKAVVFRGAFSFTSQIYFSSLEYKGLYNYCLFCRYILFTHKYHSSEHRTCDSDNQRYGCSILYNVAFATLSTHMEITWRYNMTHLIL